MDVGVLQALGDMSFVLVAGSERLAAEASAAPFMVLNHCKSSQSLSSFYGDVVVYSGTS